ncbi:Protein SOB FIVE-LIKE 6 [Cardamine amara subsp. amara]|uniref:Protein SOB FIVE-LIKE 6 n=1 Tax=Cardamine amara subsp. amara TaxID=228776 RepID=A0ABD0ZI83_CARAN
MDLSDLDYSDAGDSGWTMYLDHSSSSVSLHHFVDHNNGETNQEHDEDSSMVSDASSGPPYYCEEAVPQDILQQNTQYWCKSKIKNKNKNKKTNNMKVHEEHKYSQRFNSFLDDTASSLPAGEEVSAQKQHRDQYQRLDDLSQSYSTRRIFKGNFNSGYLQQAFPVEKLTMDHQLV